jgi:hypothetical protein
MQENMLENMQDKKHNREADIKNTLAHINRWVIGFMNAIKLSALTESRGEARDGEEVSHLSQNQLDDIYQKALEYRVDPLQPIIDVLLQEGGGGMSYNEGEHYKIIMFLICGDTDPEAGAIRKVLSCLGHNIHPYDSNQIIAMARLLLQEGLPNNYERSAQWEALMNCGLCMRALREIANCVSSLMVSSWSEYISLSIRDGDNSLVADEDLVREFWYPYGAAEKSGVSNDQESGICYINMRMESLGEALAEYESLITKLVESLLNCHALGAFIVPSAEGDAAFSLEDINLFHDGLLRVLAYAQTLYALFVVGLGYSNDDSE